MGSPNVSATPEEIDAAWRRELTERWPEDVREPAARDAYLTARADYLSRREQAAAGDSGS